MRPAYPGPQHTFSHGDTLLMNPAIIPAGIAAVGSILGGAQQNRAARKEAQRNRNFQERMRDTAWQAAVSDMQAAGINPALAYSKGPASAPGGSMASQEDILSGGVSSAMQATRMKKELALLDRQIDQASAQAQKTGHEAIFQERMNRLWGNWDARGKFTPGPLWNKYTADANSAGSIARLRELEIPAMENLASIAGTETGKYAAWIQYLLRAIGKGR